MTGDVFRGYLLDGFFNLVGALTGQGILLVGMMTEAVALLERITDEPGKAPLLEAIGDGTFGLMKRPADRGKGVDGVVTQGDGYWNPATEILEGRQ
jgi:beta-lysine 5,6-aminomutase alpha subunit